MLDQILLEAVLGIVYRTDFEKINPLPVNKEDQGVDIEINMSITTRGVIATILIRRWTHFSNGEVVHWKIELDDVPALPKIYLSTDDASPKTLIAVIEDILKILGMDPENKVCRKNQEKDFLFTYEWSQNPHSI